MPSAKQIRRHLGVPDVVSMEGNGAAQPTSLGSPLDTALNARERYQGQRMIDADERRAKAESAAEVAIAEEAAAAAELKTEESRLRVQQLRQQVEGGGGGNVQMLSQIIALLQDDKNQQAALAEESRKEVMVLLTGQIADLRNQVLTRAAAPSENGHQPPTLTEQITDAKGLLDTIRSLLPEPAPSATALGANMAGSIQELTQLWDMEDRRKERQDDRAEAHEVRMTQLQQSRMEYEDGRHERLARVDEDKRRGTAVTETLQRAIPFAREVVGMAGERLLGGRGGAAGAAASASINPADTRYSPCSACKTLIPFPLGQNLAECPECKVPHSLETPPPASEDTPPAPVEEPQPEAAPPLVTAEEQAESEESSLVTA